MLKNITLILFIFFPFIAHAEEIPLSFTDRLYSDGTWYPGAATTISVNNKDGLAWRFVLTDTWNVSSISGFMTGIDIVQGGQPAPGRAQFFLYQGSDFNSSQNHLKPTNQFFFESNQMNVPLDNVNREYQQSVNLNLTPGDYWFRADGGSDGGIIKVNDFKMAGTVTTPEPASLLLLGGGLMAGIGLRRKNAKG